MSDAHFGSTFGPSTIGALNVVAGTTHGVSPAGCGENGHDDRATPSRARRLLGAAAATMTGKNIGDLMNAAGVTWGWFAGGFSRPVPNGHAVCGHAQERRRRGRRRLPPAPQAVPVLRLDGEPAPRAADVGGQRSASTDAGQPPVRPDRLRRGAGRRQPAAGLVPEGDRRPRTRTPATRARSTSSASSCARSTRSRPRRSGARPRSSWPTTTPTAGTTT